MKENQIKVIAVLSIALFSFFVLPNAAIAGALKSKIQTRLNEGNQMQYEPYYSESSYEASSLPAKDTEAKRSVGGAVQTQAFVNVSPVEKPFSELPTPASYAVYQTDYRADLEENVVTVKGKIVFQVFRDGWTQIPLADSKVGLIDVSVNRSTAYVIMQGGKYYLVIDKAGKYTLNLEFLIKAQRERENGPGSFNFDVIPAPISQYEFAILETGVEIFVEPAIKVEVEKLKDKTTAWAVMPNTSSIMTRWTKELPKEQITQVKLEPKVYLESFTYASVGEGVIRCEARLDYSILQSEISNLRLVLPPDVSLLDVHGKDLRDWKVSKEKDVQYLDAYLNFGVKGKYTLEVSYEKNIGEGSVVAEIPALKALAAEREKGFFGIAAVTNVELAVNKLDRATPIDVKELPSAIWGRSVHPILLAFKYLNHPFVIAIEVTRHEELPVLAAAVDSAEFITLYTQEGKVLTKAIYQVKNTSEQFLRFSLPKGSALWSTFVSGNPVKPASDKDGNILVPLQKSQMEGETLTRFPVEIVYLDNAKALKGFGSLKVNLPQISLPVSEMTWSLYCPYKFAYFRFQGNVEPVRGFSAFGGFGDLRLGIRGQLRSSADDIGEQFAPGAVQYALKEEIQKGFQKGVLPIKIDVPTRGELLRFTKLLVAEKESPYVTMSYVRAFKGVGRLLRFVIIVGAIIFVIKGLRAHGRRKKEQKQASGSL